MSRSAESQMVTGAPRVTVMLCENKAPFRLIPASATGGWFKTTQETSLLTIFDHPEAASDIALFHTKSVKE